MGGVSFTCIASSIQSDGVPELEIFSKDNNFYLRDIQFKVVSEIDVEKQESFSSLQMKQICGEFSELTEYQKSQLDIFLQNLALSDS